MNVIHKKIKNFCRYVSSNTSYRMYYCVGIKRNYQQKKKEKRISLLFFAYICYEVCLKNNRTFLIRFSFFIYI